MKLLFLFVVAMVLGACAAPTPKIDIIETQKLILVEPDPQYLNDCELVEPPSKAFFQSLGVDERDDVLTRTLLKQISLTQTCTQDKRSLRKQVLEQRQIIDQHNLEETQRVSKLKQGMEKTP